MAQASVTQIKTAEPGTQNGDVAFPQELSLFVGEAITPRIGTFIQLTYDGAEGSIGIDNADIRYANHARLGSKDLIYGVTLNNNPTVQDVWNTTPVWGFPYNASGVAPSPAAATLIDGGLEMAVAGLGAYAMYDDLLYAEFNGYRPAQQGGREPALHGIADDEIVHLEQRLAHATTSVARWHAASWREPTRRSSGSSTAQRSIARSQRGRNGQPTISWSSRGGVPGIETTTSRDSRSGVAASERSLAYASAA